MSAPQTVDEYISLYPKEVQRVLEKIRIAIKKSAPGAKEVMGYGIPTFKLNGNLVHFGAFKTHIGFYPSPQAIVHFKNKLTRYKQAKGSVQFPLNEKIPIDLITEIVEYRVKQSSS